MEGHGKIIELVVPERWEVPRDKPDGIFLIFELFQIRSIALPFSEVSLDIVQLASEPIIFHTTVNEILLNAPVIDHLVKFALLKEGFWNRLLYNYGRPLVYQVPHLLAGENKTMERFPLASGEVKEMFLGPEGEVKMLKR